MVVLTTFILLTAIATNDANLSCTPLDKVKHQMPFCWGIFSGAYNNSDTLFHKYAVPSNLNIFAQDSLSRHASDTILTMTAACQGVVITERCVEAFRTYSCLSNFPLCNAEASVPIKPPCKDYCVNYCTLCSLSYCPCGPLPTPIKGVESGNNSCVTLEDGHLCENDYVAPSVGSCKNGVSSVKWLGTLVSVILLGTWLLSC